MRRASTIGIALALAAAAGCGRNHPSDLLVSTGIHPRPEVGTAAIRAQLCFDPAQFPDLATPPYPRAAVSLYLGGQLVATDTLDGSTRWFEFDSLQAGTYQVTSSAHLFYSSTLGPITVRDVLVDAGDDTLRVNPSAIASTVHLAGDFNGFPPDFPDSIAMEQNTLGVWTYPNVDYPAQTIPAGTYRLRFVTDFSYDNPTDYGGSEAVTYTVPVADAPTRFVSGAGTNLTIQVGTTGPYRFTLDERRQTFSVDLLPRAEAHASRRPIP